MKRTIAYVGDDLDIVKGIRSFADLELGPGELDLHSAPWEAGGVLGACASLGAQVVIIDFSSPGIDKQAVVEEMACAKACDQYYQVLFAGLWADADACAADAHMFSSGMLYSHVKGDELDKFLGDVLYIALDERLYTAKYAKARDLKYPYRGHLCSSISHLIYDGLALDTDLVPEGRELVLAQSLFAGLEGATYKVLSSGGAPHLYPALGSVQLEWPYCGAWEPAGAKCLMRDTYETWLSLNKDDLDRRRSTLLFVSQNPGLLKDLHGLMKGTPLFLSYRTALPSPGELLRVQRPEVIMLDLASAEHPSLGLDKVKECVSAIKCVPDYAPLVLVFNCESKSEALRKAHTYPHFVSLSGRPTAKSVSLFMKSYELKGGREPVGTFLRPGDPRRAVGVALDLHLSSLTEHEVTFFCAAKLPMFGVLLLDLSFPALVTIVPATQDLEYGPQGTHYMGLIHGIGEDRREALRKLVNQMIFRPLPSFGPAEIKAAILRWDERNKSGGEGASPGPVQASPAAGAQVNQARAAGKRRSFERSKL